MDGGSENTAKAALAVCELLVARRLTRRVVLSRLLVGHTHEDIDAIFAIIWQFLKTRKVMTPQTYAKLLAMACKNKEKSVDVIDIWTVPDYQSYFEKFINSDLGSYAKGKWSQLQIFFEAVDMCEKYPMGVKVSHRAFSAGRVKLLKKLRTADSNKEDKQFKEMFESLEKEVIADVSETHFPGIIWDENETIEEESSGEEPVGDDDIGDKEESEILNVGYKPIEMIVETFENERSVLKSFPSGLLKPQEFVEGSFKSIQKTAGLVKQRFGGNMPGVAYQWDQFLLSAPKSDNVYDFVKDHPLYIPFKKELFQIDEEGYAAARDQSAAKEIQTKKDAEAFANTSSTEFEIWRSAPCMSKKSKLPFERVKAIVENGKVNSEVLS